MHRMSFTDGEPTMSGRKRFAKRSLPTCSRDLRERTRVTSVTAGLHECSSLASGRAAVGSSPEAEATRSVPEPCLFVS